MTGRTCKPSFYDAFRCIGSACTDTCCAGWEIDIDDVSYERYMELKGAFKQRLLAQIGTDGTSHFFRLQEGQRCPFLNQDNLCDIFIEAGEDYLCDICTEHPRFYNWYGDYTEVGLGMCCEEAQRLMLESETPLTFVVTGEAEDMSEFLPLLLSLRGQLFAILQDRSQSIWQRMTQVQWAAEQAQTLLDMSPEEDWAVLLEYFVTQLSVNVGDTVERTTWMPLENASWRAEQWADVEQLESLLQRMAGDRSVLELLVDIISFFRKLEILDEAWPACLWQIQTHLSQIWDHRQAFLTAYENRCYEYEHLMVYFLYRYFLEGVYNLELCAGVDFAWVSVVMILLCDIAYWMEHGELPFEKQCAIIRLYSKEIEYCPENVEAVCQYARELRRSLEKN
ncbi:MAG: flagellin lysine-N-methylase [Lachnospiraceae bacterium]|nr:flagellin lysine-N-methylase [Lachnospiraceae bacterium]